MLRRRRYAFRQTNYRQRQEFAHRMQGIFAICIIIAIVAGIYIQLDREVMPSVMAMAKAKATALATEAINESIRDTLSAQQITTDDLLSYDYNDKGELISWNVNSILINQICTDIVTNTNQELQHIGEVSLKMPLGNATGSRIFANLGPDIIIKVMPVGTVKVDYSNDIRSTGINQVNHVVWLNIDATVQVVVPLFSDQVQVKRKVILIDKVISGQVPPSYVNVPKESILDVAPADLTEDMLP
ncbi:MAG: sporulation protein YunB [Cellulosilyticaceae bacterium]